MSTNLHQNEFMIKLKWAPNYLIIYYMDIFWSFYMQNESLGYSFVKYEILTPAQTFEWNYISLQKTEENQYTGYESKYKLMYGFYFVKALKV